MNTDTWIRAALQDVTSLWIVGGTPPRTDPACYVRKGGTPWAKAEDVRGGVLYDTVERLSEAGGRQITLVPKDSVLLTTAGTIGRAAIAGEPMYCNQAVQALRFREDQVLPWFAMCYLQSRRPALVRQAGSASIPYISKRKLESMEIRYPPLPVQRRIVELMQLAWALCERAAGLRGLVEKYLRAITLREAEQAGVYKPLGELLEGRPQSGLRAKSSSEGAGIALVSGFGGVEGRLTSLEECPRTEVSPTYAARFELRPGDLLLRSAAKEALGRGVLVGELSERALVGGTLIRLRPGQGSLSAWLLAWLLGPGSDRLYIDGKLRRQALEEHPVPVPRDARRFERMFDLYLDLLEKGRRYSGRAQALYDALLSWLFADAGMGDAFYQTGPVGAEKNIILLPQAMEQFLRQMSRFQQDLYRTLALSDDGRPAHVLLKQMRMRRTRANGIQDALSSMALLEQFGFAERESSQKIPALPGGMDPAAQEDRYITDHNGRPVFIDAYSPVKGLSEENEYAAGAGENSEL